MPSCTPKFHDGSFLNCTGISRFKCWLILQICKDAIELARTPRRSVLD